MKHSLVISDAITIDSSYIEIVAVRSSGPGGQNVNKTSTKIQLKCDFEQCPTIPETTKEVIRNRKSLRFDKDGKLTITSQEFRTQKANIERAYEKLKDIIVKSLIPKKVRKKTLPGFGATQERIQHKKKHSEIKRKRSEKIFLSDE